ncbi:MAG: signal peptidase II [Anaerolineae bacterium]|nr:signal peptidase II [Anaerolineae bacterium]
MLDFLKPTPLKLALLLPGIAFLLLELILEPDAVRGNLPGLFIWAVFYYLLASLAVSLRQRGVRPPSFRRLLGYAVLLAALDHAVKLIVLRWLPLEQAYTVIPAALALTHTHNLRNSWVAVQFDLDFIGDWLLIGAALLFSVLTLAIYRYYAGQRSQPPFFAALAMAGFVAGLSSAVVELVLRGFTVDYLAVAGLVVADLKDFYLDIAIAALAAEIAENHAAAWRMSTRETLHHVKAALVQSAQEIKERLRH